MFRLKALLVLSLVATSTYAFQDYDIDGIEDSVDRCPNTPFDAIVDRYGCTVEERDKYIGRFTLQVGVQMYQDADYGGSSALNLLANYRYRDWDITLSNLRTTTVGSFVNDNMGGDNDIYLSIGHFFSVPNGSVKVTLGTRFLGSVSQASDTYPFRGNSRFSTQNDVSPDNDYFASLNYNYQLNTKQDLFLFGGYTITGDTPTQTYENYASFSIGTGYSITRSLYGSIAYNYVGSVYPDGEAEQSLSLFANYRFNRTFFGSLTYRYGLNDLSYVSSFTTLYHRKSNISKHTW